MSFFRSLWNSVKKAACAVGNAVQRTAAWGWNNKLEATVITALVFVCQGGGIGFFLGLGMSEVLASVLGVFAGTAVGGWLIVRPNVLNYENELKTIELNRLIAKLGEVNEKYKLKQQELNNSNNLLQASVREMQRFINRLKKEKTELQDQIRQLSKQLGLTVIPQTSMPSSSGSCASSAAASIAASFSSLFSQASTSTTASVSSSAPVSTSKTTASSSSSQASASPPAPTMRHARRPR